MKSALPALLLLCTPAQAHDAPSGWAYPKQCCDNQDCRPIRCSEIVALPNRGGPEWQGWLYTRANVKFHSSQPSGDGHCHACFTSAGTPETPHNGRCLFVPVTVSWRAK